MTALAGAVAAGGTFVLVRWAASAGIPSPAVYVRALSGLLVLLAAAAGLSVAIVALGTAAGHHLLWHVIHPCSHAYSPHVSPPRTVSVVAAVAAAAVAVRARSHWRLGRPAVRVPAGGPFVVVPDRVPLAFAVPGSVVVSQGLLDALTPEEQAVVIVHEQTHLDRHHLGYLRLAGLAGAVVPFLRPVERAVRHGVERWADEETAAVVGDRRLVARTLAKVALLGTAAPAGAPAAAASDAADRVRSLLVPPGDGHRRGLVAGLVPVSAAAAVAVVGRADAFGELVRHLCP